MMRVLPVLTATVLLLTFISTQDLPGHHPAAWPRFQIIGNRLETTEKWHRFGVVAETRQYACARNSPKSSKSECELRFGEGLSAVNDNGCFMHHDAVRHESVELCPLQCQRFDEARILKTSDSLICSPGVGVGVERRHSDWFMWRSGACRSADVIFQFECSTAPPQRTEEEEREEVGGEEMLADNINAQTVEQLVDNGPTDNAIADEEMGISSSIEDITSLSREATTTVIPAKKPETGENEDDLPEKVDTLLGFMFPSYRKKAH
ncbi:unnamed protein product [Caenorhabditis sp. 36 PRJEB53466]|nr:unnamed protein product [Caenorhabditis sp. 36 PRJEB53466]